jgi:hypothetical protein
MTCRTATVCGTREAGLHSNDMQLFFTRNNIERIGGLLGATLTPSERHSLEKMLFEERRRLRTFEAVAVTGHRTIALGAAGSIGQAR